MKMNLKEVTIQSMKSAALDNMIPIKVENVNVNIYAFVISAMGVMLEHNVTDKNKILADMIVSIFDVSEEVASSIVEIAFDHYVEAYSK